MTELSEMIRKTLFAGVAVSIFVVACSGSSGGGSSGSGGDGGSSGGDGGGDGGVTPADNCSSFAGAYDVTSEIVTTDCPLGLHTISQPVTWTFVQTAPSCSFTMTNSLYKGPIYSGYFTMQGTQAKVTWTSVDPAPVSGGHALTYTSENLIIAAPHTVSGSFAWSSAYGCTGTTNICHGSVPAGCLTPN